MTEFAGRNLMRTAAILLCSAAFGLTAVAQSGTDAPPPPQGQTQGPPPHDGAGGGRRGGGPEQRLAMMQSQLNLTPDQSEKVKAILADGRTQMMALRNDTSSQDDRRTKMAGLMKTESEKIKALLTSDQKVKFEELEKKQREQMRDRRGNGGDGPPPPPPSAPQS